MLPALGFGAGPSGVGASTAGLGSAGAAGGGGPVGIIAAMVIASFLEELLKKSPEKKAREQMETMEELGYQKPFQNPYLPQMSEAAFRGSLGQMGQTAGWGWPADRQPDTSWIDEMSRNIQPAQAQGQGLDINAMISKFLANRRSGQNI